MGKSDKQPKVWICNSRTTGDYNNGLAVAEALNPNYRIVEDFRDLTKNDDGTFKVIFAETRLSNEHTESVEPKDFPDVLIDSSDHHPLFHFFYSKEKFKNLRADSLLANTLIVGIDPPDMGILIDQKILRKDLADINIIFTHQVSNDVNLASNMHAFDLVPSRVNQTILKDYSEAGENLISEFKLEHPIHAVIIGHQGGLSIDEHLRDVKSLAEKTINSIKKTSGSLIVTTSPRTQEPETVLNIFNKAAEDMNIKICADKYNEDPQKNNYLKILSAADKIIFTGDSISISSDAVATGKPVYLFNWSDNQHTLQYNLNEITPKKYNNTLIERGYIMPISKVSEPLPTASHFNSAEKMAQLIKDELKNRKKPKTTILSNLVRKISPAVANEINNLGKSIGFVMK